MPYIWTEPEMVVEHNGVKIYNTYQNGQWEYPRSYHFTTDVTEQPENKFDIRDLPEYDKHAEYADGWLDTQKATEILIAAIENRHIQAVDEEEHDEH
jgi:hypothetical protein